MITRVVSIDHGKEDNNLSTYTIIYNYCAQIYYYARYIAMWLLRCNSMHVMNARNMNNSHVCLVYDRLVLASEF